MPDQSADTYDAIIIGAGISGLVCGCFLARAGRKVVVLEQHDKPGGYFTSFRRKGFLFDAAAHSFGNYREGGHVRKILTDLGVDRLVAIKRYDPSDRIITPDFTLTFRSDTEATIRELSAIFPDERDNLRRFFSFLTSADQTAFVRLKDKTFAYLLESFFRDQRLMSAFAFPVFGNGGLPPSLMHAFSGIKVFSEFLVDGGYYPEGGIQRLPDALALMITANGGAMRYKSLVTKILSIDGRVRGVELAGGEQLRSGCVVSCGDMTEAYTKLLGDGAAAPEQLSTVKTMTPSLSTFICYLGLDKPFDGLPDAGTNVWLLGDYDLDSLYTRIRQCLFNRPPAFMYRVSPDRKTVLAFMTAPFVDPLYWKAQKRAVAEDFLESLDRAVPGLKQHVAYFDAGSPATLHRYTLNHEAAAFGWAKLPGQVSGIFDAKRPPLKGLSFAGHWTGLGFGMPGACYSGYETAKRILRSR